MASGLSRPSAPWGIVPSVLYSNFVSSLACNIYSNVSVERMRKFGIDMEVDMKQVRERGGV